MKDFFKLFFENRIKSCTIRALKGTCELTIGLCCTSLLTMVAKCVGQCLKNGLNGLKIFTFDHTRFFGTDEYERRHLACVGGRVRISCCHYIGCYHVAIRRLVQ